MRGIAEVLQSDPKVRALLQAEWEKSTANLERLRPEMEAHAAMIARFCARMRISRELGIDYMLCADPPPRRRKRGWRSAF